MKTLLLALAVMISANAQATVNPTTWTDVAIFSEQTSNTYVLNWDDTEDATANKSMKVLMKLNSFQINECQFRLKVNNNYHRTTVAYSMFSTEVDSKGSAMRFFTGIGGGLGGSREPRESYIRINKDGAAERLNFHSASSYHTLDVYLQMKCTE